MHKEKEKFKSISLLLVYVYMKDKYNNLENINDDRQVNLEDLNKMTLKLEKYAHIPNQEVLLEESYDGFVSQINDGKFNEEYIFENLEYTTNLETQEREYILNSVIYVANQDKVITDKEKKAIIQVAHFLGFDFDFNKILKSYNKSDFVEKLSNKTFSLIAFLSIIALCAVGVYFYFNFTKNKVNIFNQDRVVFSDISFDRYIVYGNKFNIESKYFKKQAIYYINGTAEVGFEPQNISYDSLKNTITLSYTQGKVFNIKSIFDDSFLLVDEIKPKGISSKDARFAGAFLSVPGAVLGAKAGGVVGKLLPKPFKLLSKVAGGVLGGGVTFYIASTYLTGKKLSDNISETEKEEVKENSKKLISILLYTDKNLVSLYKRRFEEYIKAKYLLAGIKIKNIEYKEIKNEKTK